MDLTGSMVQGRETWLKSINEPFWLDTDVPLLDIEDRAA